MNSWYPFFCQPKIVSRTIHLSLKNNFSKWPLIITDKIEFAPSNSQHLFLWKLDNEFCKNRIPSVFKILLSFMLKWAEAQFFPITKPEYILSDGFPLFHLCAVRASQSLANLEFLFVFTSQRLDIRLVLSKSGQIMLLRLFLYHYSYPIHAGWLLLITKTKDAYWQWFAKTF